MANRESKPFGIDHDYSAIGTFDVEPQLQKGQQVKASLQGVVDGIASEDLTEEGVKIEIKLSSNLRLMVIPRFPVDKIVAGEAQETPEPFVIRDATGEIEYEEEDLPTIVLTGRSDLPSDGPDTFYKFDPLAGHDLIARAVDGDYRNNGVRVASGEGEPVLRLEVY